MKTITCRKISLYLLEDNETVNITENNIIIGDPVSNTIWDCNSSNAFLHESVATPPDDWTGQKYLYDGTKWLENSNYVEPSSD
tara:strand:- start:62 stop:310 length:249 start_codon:yes stop_codon:yes gene_type:complete